MGTYDAIVIGARCAGAPTAMLLAQRGHRVLVVDRSTFPSDTLSTHIIHAPGVAALGRWDLLDQVVATNCPPIERYTMDFGPLALSGRPRPVGGSSTAYAPRRTKLDKILVDAAAKAGAEVREGFSVDDVVFDGDRVAGIRGRSAGGAAVVEHATVVIGADGRHSSLARAVHPEEYNTKPPLQTGYYTYWSGLDVSGVEIFVRPDRGWAAAPTNDGLTMLVLGWPQAEASANKTDIEGNYLKTLELAPEFAERVRAATREERFVGGSVPGYFRKPYGPGWVLVGDAAYNKDPITAQGISDAFADAERTAAVLGDALNGEVDFDEAMAAAQRERDEHRAPMYEFTSQLATLEPPPPDLQQLFAALHGNQSGTDDFLSVMAGTVSPADFFAPDRVAAYLAAAAVPASL